jgi:hypothetical protein
LEKKSQKFFRTSGNQTKSLNLKDLRSFDNFAGFNTAGANFLATVTAGGQLDANRLQIRIKAATGFVVCVGNIVSELRTFSADVASFCHKNLKASKSIIPRYG